jgi:hypothetical protein
MKSRYVSNMIGFVWPYSNGIDQEIQYFCGTKILFNAAQSNDFESDVEGKL